MSEPQQDEMQIDLADALLSGPEWDRWLAEHPAAATQVLVLQQARLFLSDLRARQVEVPAGFEERLMARVRGDATARAVLTLGVPQFGSALLELFAALFGLLPQAPEERDASVGNS
jgi:chemotaxis regulatin CheY-phosphate phosphatase CheZ